MKIGWKKIVLTAVVIAALFVSGCSGTDTGGNATPTPSPTPTPQPGSSPTATPAWNTVESPTRTSQLYDMSRLNWYEFRYDSTSQMMSSSGYYRFEFDDRTYRDVATRHTRETYTDLILGSADSPDSIIDTYASKTNNSVLGGHVKMTSSGRVTMDQEMSGSQIVGMMNGGYGFISMLDRDARLTSAGTGTISLNGKQYDCTKYTYTVDGIIRTAWYTPEAPAPLKVTWTLMDETRPVYVTVSLTGWG